uniref:Uncharacterized protein n=1 Tax=Arundo donax TaxID=35708 RepID=A0A0A8Z4N1_ARUDO
MVCSVPLQLYCAYNGLTINFVTIYQLQEKFIPNL